MSDMFKQARGLFTSTLLFVWPVALVLAIGSLFLMREDFRTSQAGYLAIPTVKIDYDWVPLVVAGLPQGVKIVAGYWLLKDQNRRWLKTLWLSFFIVDVGTDTIFKSGGSWELAPLALVESVLIYTIGSEIIFTLMVGFLVETFEEFSRAIAGLFKSLMMGAGIIIAGLTGLDEQHPSEKDPRDPQVSYRKP